jgi:hypothetical protein
MLDLCDGVGQGQALMAGSLSFGLHQSEAVARLKKQQIDNNHTQEGIGHCHKSAGQGKERDGKWRWDERA